MDANCLSFHLQIDDLTQRLRDENILDVSPCAYFLVSMHSFATFTLRIPNLISFWPEPNRANPFLMTQNVKFSCTCICSCTPTKTCTHTSTCTSSASSCPPSCSCTHAFPSTHSYLCYTPIPLSSSPCFGAGDKLGPLPFFFVFSTFSKLLFSAFNPAPFADSFLLRLFRGIASSAISKMKNNQSHCHGYVWNKAHTSNISIT